MPMQSSLKPNQPAALLPNPFQTPLQQFSKPSQPTPLPLKPIQTPVELFSKASNLALPPLTSAAIPIQTSLKANQPEPLLSCPIQRLKMPVKSEQISVQPKQPSGSSEPNAVSFKVDVKALVGSIWLGVSTSEIMVNSVAAIGISSNLKEYNFTEGTNSEVKRYTLKDGKVVQMNPTMQTLQNDYFITCPEEEVSSMKFGTFLKWNAGLLNFNPSADTQMIIALDFDDVLAYEFSETFKLNLTFCLDENNFRDQVCQTDDPQYDQKNIIHVGFFNVTVNSKLISLPEPTTTPTKPVPMPIKPAPKPINPILEPTQLLPTPVQPAMITTHPIQPASKSPIFASSNPILLPTQQSPTSPPLSPSLSPFNPPVQSPKSTILPPMQPVGTMPSQQSSTSTPLSPSLSPFNLPVQSPQSTILPPMQPVVTMPSQQSPTSPPLSPSLLPFNPPVQAPKSTILPPMQPVGTMPSQQSPTSPRRKPSAANVYSIATTYSFIIYDGDLSEEKISYLTVYLQSMLDKQILGTVAEFSKSDSYCFRRVLSDPQTLIDSSSRRLKNGYYYGCTYCTVRAIYKGKTPLNREILDKHVQKAANDLCSSITVCSPGVNQRGGKSKGGNKSGSSNHSSKGGKSWNMGGRSKSPNHSSKGGKSWNKGGGREGAMKS